LREAISIDFTTRLVTFPKAALLDEASLADS
jgi:hypothetical protein